VRRRLQWLGRRTLAERRVTVVQGVDGMGYVTGEVSAADAAAIDGMLAATARSLGADDLRTEQQRRSDLFADLLLGRLRLDEPDQDQEQTADGDWLEVENIDPETGELLGTQLQRIDGDGESLGEPADAASQMLPGRTPRLVRRSRRQRIGVVVPLASLLGTTDAPAELADRSGLLPAALLREHIADAFDPNSRDEVLFTRLLTRQWRSAARHHRARPLSLSSAGPGDQDPRRHLSVPNLHRPRRSLRP
jgi:Domain of unknown function (DUF222)